MLTAQAIWSRAPLLPVAIGLVAGILIDQDFQPQPLIHAIAAGLGAVAGIAFRRRRDLLPHVAVVLVAAGAGGMLHFARSRLLPPLSIALDATDDRPIVRIRGVVSSAPRVVSDREHPFARWIARDERTVFVLDVESIEGESGFIPRTGRIRVVVREAVLRLAQRSRVELFGRLYPLMPPENPGVYNWASYNRREGIMAGMTCLHRENVRALASAPISDVGRWVLAYRRAARELLTGDLAASEQQSGLLDAMILGHRSILDRQINDVFIRAGIIHFIAVSGVNVAIVMMLARTLFRTLGGTVRQSTFAMIAAAVLFAILTEPRPPVLRACVIGIVYGLAVLLGRARYQLNWVCATVILLALIDPSMIFDVGYQLSTAAVIGVVFLTPVVQRAGNGAAALIGFNRDSAFWRLPRASVGLDRFWGWSARWHALRVHIAHTLATAAAVALAAWLMGSPIVAWHFYRIQLWGAVATLMIFPLVSLAMALGFAKLILSMLLPTLAVWIGYPLLGTEWLLIRAADFFAGLPLSSAVVARPPTWLVIVYYAWMTLLMIRFRRRNASETGHPARGAGTAVLQDSHEQTSVHGRRAFDVMLMLLAVVVLVGSLDWLGGRSVPRDLRATFLSVGAGTAVVLELPDGHVALYDAGTSSAYDVGRQTIVPYFQSRGIRRIDTIYVSHANLDHFSGLPSIAEGVRIGEVVVNEHFPYGEGAPSHVRHLLMLLGENGVPVRVMRPDQSTWKAGEVTFERLWPVGNEHSKLAANDASTVLRVSFAGRSILLPGDIQYAAQQAIIRRGDVASDVLMLPHHGGVQANTGAFIDAVGANLLIRSHYQSWEDTDNGLKNLTGGRRVFSTADVGAVQITIRPDGQLGVSTFAAGTASPAFGVTQWAEQE
ncbi:MAG: ComEC/Rec2 family competence protein [Phycisphaerae bacterium]|nr:ComEC/Rec2 family competence protein [Phycisphaerae bacterium]